MIKKIVKKIFKFIDNSFNSDYFGIFLYRIFQKIKYFKILFFLNIQNLIFKKIILNKKEINIIFDYKCAPPTYGDFIAFLMLVKFFVLCQINVKLFIVNDEFRDDWSKLSKIQKNELINAHNRFLESIVDKSHCSIIRLPWFKFYKKLNELSFFNTFLYHNVKKRKEVYGQAINFLNLQNLNSDIFLRKNFLLNKNLFSNFGFKKKPPNKYVTFHARYQEKWQASRNVTANEFDNKLIYLYSKFPKHKIIVLTDEIGKKYYEKNSKCIRNILSFSKEYSSTFYGDTILLLNSDFYYQYKGGGIGIIAMFSSIPYFIECELSTEIMLTNIKFFSWQERKQDFKLIRNYN